MVEQPALQSADTDGDGHKRRRRPALSCVECRVRKVKCDREKPCRACTRINSATCTYRTQRAGIRARHDRSSENASTSVSGRNEPDSNRGGSARPSPKPSGSSNEFDLMINRYVAPGAFGEHDNARLKPLLSNRPNLDLSSQSSGGNAAIVTSLLDRINTLESKLAATSLTEHLERGSQPAQDCPAALSGSFVKSKFYGQSHWVNAIEPYDALGEANTTLNHSTNRTEVNKSTELYVTVAEIKRMARIIKTSRMLQPTISADIQKIIPPKEMCDALVEGYLRTFEGIYRVLHIPSFRTEYEGYWNGTVPAKPSVVLKILLVCAIGVPFYTGENQPRLRTSSAKWIQAAADWQCAPHAKSRLNMAGLQTQILTILARQVCNVDGDHIWIPAGSLLRTAMHLGLHRDPSHFGKISIYHSEMRRRLWATVLEITAQTSLDMGMPPMISANDYDTAPPANIDDEHIAEGRDTPIEEQPLNVYTDCSIQIAFTQTLPIRLEIIRLINNLRFDLSYSEVLRLGAELTGACRHNTTFFKTALAARCNITAFQIKLADCLVRRFVLCLHRPYFAKANEHPQYHYSRKICLDTSLAIYAPATQLLPGEEDDWTRMTHRSVGGFKSFFLYGMSTIYYELNSQIKERQEDSTLFAPLISTASTPSTRPMTLPAQFEALRDVLRSALQTAIAWIRNGGTNAKGVVFLECALARIDALVSGADAEQAVLEAAKRSVKETGRIMAAAYRDEHGEDINLNPYIGPFGGKDHGRGEGADDVTGQHLRTGTDAYPEAVGDVPSATISDVEAFDLLEGDLNSMGMDMDLDLNAYMQGQSMDTGNAYHFGRSPEWFYELSGWATSGGLGAGFNAFPS